MEDWDVSNVKDMKGLFVNTKITNIDLSKWDPKSVTDTSHMFSGCDKFTGKTDNPNGYAWDMPELEVATCMFKRCTNLDMWVNFKVSDNLTEMSSMFYGCSNFNNGGKPLTFMNNLMNNCIIEHMLSSCTKFNNGNVEMQWINQKYYTDYENILYNTEYIKKYSYEYHVQKCYPMVISKLEFILNDSDLFDLFKKYYNYKINFFYTNYKIDGITTYYMPKKKDKKDDKKDGIITYYMPKKRDNKDVKKDDKKRVDIYYEVLVDNIKYLHKTVYIKVIIQIIEENIKKIEEELREKNKEIEENIMGITAKIEEKLRQLHIQLEKQEEPSQSYFDLYSNLLKERVNQYIQLLKTYYSEDLPYWYCMPDNNSTATDKSYGTEIYKICLDKTRLNIPINIYIRWEINELFNNIRTTINELITIKSKLESYQLPYLMDYMTRILYYTKYYTKKQPTTYQHQLRILIPFEINRYNKPISVEYIPRQENTSTNRYIDPLYDRG